MMSWYDGCGGSADRGEKGSTGCSPLDGVDSTMPCCTVAATPPRATGNILRVAMTAADIPLTTGQPRQGSEGIRFMGITAYDALVNWDLSRPDVAATIRSGLAESWSVDPAQTTRWTFRLPRNVTFHDGSAFTADSVVWNLDKLIRRDARFGVSLCTISTARTVAAREGLRAGDKLAAGPDHRRTGLIGAGASSQAQPGSATSGGRNTQAGSTRGA
jgi:ABC-type transport system substrate-binding protein